MQTKNNKPLDINKYFNGLRNAFVYINKNINISNNLIPEQKFIFPIVNTKDAVINFKGFIDLVDETTDIIYDWKTNSSIQNFNLHARIYCYAYWKMYNRIPKAIYYYCNVDKPKIYYFTKDEVLETETELNDLCKEIIGKGHDISKYDLGNYNHIFNVHLQKCKREALNRQDSDVIQYNIEKNNIIFRNLNNNLKNIIDKKFSYYINGHEFSDLFKKRIWDGKTHLFSIKSNKLPIGLFTIFKKLLNQYNKYSERDYKLELKYDLRNKDIMSNQFETKFKDNKDIELRYYQNDAIKSAIENKIGIIYGGTGCGKSIISAEIIKNINKRSLYIINRIELVDQTAEVFEEYLGIEIGKMSEGNLDINKQVTIASIQTVNSLLKQSSENSKLLKKYLYNTNICIFDECQNVKDDGCYKLLSNNLTNCEYLIGMTGSPFRNDEHTLKMKALVGDVIYSKTTKDLVSENYLVPTKVYFLEYDTIFDRNYQSYSDAYTDLIVGNIERNNLIKDIVSKFENKKILIITKLIKHGKLLEELIPDSFLITSQTKKDIRKQKFKDFKDNKFNILIGSAQIFSTGIDIPDLDIILNSSGHRSDVLSTQIIGRVMRKSKNKEFGYYIDFIDDTSVYFRQATKQRIQILTEFGHEILKINDIKDIQ